MANKVLLKKSSVSAKVPTTSDLDYGELALNYADGKLYYKNASNVVQSFGTTSFIRVINSITAIAGKGYICDTTVSALTITLPASPVTGDSITLADGGDFSVNNLTVARNGSTIDGVSDNLVINIGGVQVTLTFDGITWQVYAQVGAAGGTAASLTGTQTLTNKTLTSPTINSATLSGTFGGDHTLSGLVSLSYTGVGSQGTLKIGGYNSKGGTGYHDFLQITNAYGSATNPNKFFRLNSTGGLELLNSAYSATVFTVADNGLFTIGSGGAATVSSGVAVTNGLAVGSHGTVFDDGNFHLHSTSGALWINANDGSDIIIGTQTNSGASKLQTNNISMDAGYGSRAPIYGVRAWINCGFNGSTMTTRGSGNLSVSRSAQGVYSFTFGTAMPDRNYAVTATAMTPTTNSDIAANLSYNVTPTTTGFQITTARYGSGNVDVTELHIQVVR